MTTDALKSVPPIARSSVEERVAETLRDLIVTGELPRGRRSCSATSPSGSASRRRRSGSGSSSSSARASSRSARPAARSSRRLTREDLEEIYAARLGLEGLAARLGAAAVGPAELERMRVGLARARPARARPDVDGYLGARWEFHAICYLASGRTRLVAEVERLFWRAERYHRLVLSSAERFRRSVGYYRGFFEACEAATPRRRRA